MRDLGRFGRFGNQVWQYMYQNTYAKEHDLTIQTPKWIGQYLFGISDAPIAEILPTPFRDEKIVGGFNIHGYFQYHTERYQSQKEYIKKLFAPTSEIKAMVSPAVEDLRSKGKTIVGLHLRRGDYCSRATRYLTPTKCYLGWLDSIWDTLDEPVLFVASDEPDKIVDDFARYNPISCYEAKPEQAPFYQDYYILTQCDVLAISNSSFSYTASMFNDRCKIFMRPEFVEHQLIPYDPWDALPFLRKVKK